MSIASVGAIAIGELPEAAGVMCFFAVGELLQDKAVERSPHFHKGVDGHKA